MEVNLGLPLWNLPIPGMLSYGADGSPRWSGPRSLPGAAPPSDGLLAPVAARLALCLPLE